METILNKVQDLYEIKKSKFYSYLLPAFNFDDVKIALDEIKKEHKNATHICYACVTTMPNMERCSDDGEPDGTAGKPLLELLKKRGLNNVLLVVVRYYGGIKLGAGGLIRAYTSAGVLVCDGAQIVNKINYLKYTLVCDIDDAKNVLSKLKTYEIEVTNIEYSSEVKFDIKISETETNKLKLFGDNIRIIKNG